MFFLIKDRIYVIFISIFISDVLYEEWVLAEVDAMSWESSDLENEEFTRVMFAPKVVPHEEQ